MNGGFINHTKVETSFFCLLNKIQLLCKLNIAFIVIDSFYGLEYFYRYVKDIFAMLQSIVKMKAMLQS